MSGSTPCQINTERITGWIIYLVVWSYQHNKFLVRRTVPLRCFLFTLELIKSIEPTTLRTWLRG